MSIFFKAYKKDIFCILKKKKNNNLFLNFSFCKERILREFIEFFVEFVEKFISHLH